MGFLVRFLDRAAALLFGGSRDHHGVLPPLLVVLTFVSGLVDAVSFLGLDHVFVANMTGNMAFLAFALAGAGGLSASASLLAVACFVTGVVAGGRWAVRFWAAERIFAPLVGAQALLVAGALAAGAAGAVSYVLIVMLALGMGLQNAVVHRLGVPDLTTTVLTRTLTGLVADPAGPSRVRRAVSVTVLVCGALTGGALQVHQGTVPVLIVALALLAAVPLAALAGDRRTGPARA
ncbi:YoaK family protein [Streptomyces sp. TS71-3]|uniref:YoaK family protein n=1 Tax=Streptomyces sp. TS71-3 TaxID=2733862 RepID=UPI001B0AD6B5|nr:YoaK family protein [Streptomyces sp. TS71-3]GHJ37455.1 membrane protein [Streptomyces sp. TS71-3]